MCRVFYGLDEHDGTAINGFGIVEGVSEFVAVGASHYFEAIFGGVEGVPVIGEFIFDTGAIYHLYYDGGEVDGVGVDGLYGAGWQ